MTQTGIINEAKLGDTPIFALSGNKIKCAKVGGRIDFMTNKTITNYNWIMNYWHDGESIVKGKHPERRCTIRTVQTASNISCCLHYTEPEPNMQIPRI